VPSTDSRFQLVSVLPCQELLWYNGREEWYLHINDDFLLLYAGISVERHWEWSYGHFWQQVLWLQLTNSPCLDCYFPMSMSHYLCNAVLAPVPAMTLCLSVYVCHKQEFYQNGWTNWAGFWHGSFLPSILHRVKRKFGCLQKLMVTSLWKFVPKSRLGKFCFGISIVETCYRLCLRKMDAQSVVNWTVAYQVKW